MTIISQDRRSLITEREVELSSGELVIENRHSLLADDPRGRYIIRVIIEGRLVRTFEFDVK
jgi:hypothetical protein